MTTIDDPGLQAVETTTATEPTPTPTPTPTPEGESPHEQSRRISSRALNLLAILAAITALHIAQPIVVPLLAAFLVSLLLRPLVRLLQSVHLPSPAGALVVMACLSALVVMLTLAVSAPLQEWVVRLPQVMSHTREWLEQLRAPVDQVTQMVSELEKATASTTAGRVGTVELSGSGLAEVLVVWVREALVAGGVTLLIAYFFLASGGPLLRTLISRIPHLHSSKDESDLVLGTRPTVTADQVTYEIEWLMFHYLGAITLINVGLGIAIGCVAAVMGLPNPLLWGVMFFALNYIPYIGPITGLLMITLASFSTIPDPAIAVWIPLMCLILINLEGNVLTPFVLGRAFAINPLIILLWTIMMIWLWGIAGAFLAVPLLVLVRILATRIRAMEWLVPVLNP